MTVELDLRGLVAALHAEEVAFVVIGGVAVAARGFVRGTEDLDIVPDPEHENLRRLSTALVGIKAKLPLAGDRAFVPAQDDAQLRRGRSLPLETRLGQLDVVQRLAGLPPMTPCVGGQPRPSSSGCPSSSARSLICAR